MARQYSLLWNDSAACKSRKVVRFKKINETPTESEDQIKLVAWMEKIGLSFYAVPNGGFRYMAEAVKLKLQGVKSGVPDLCIPLPSGHYHGLYIELKRVEGGVVSDKQQSWIDYLNKVGYKAIVCKGFEMAKREIEEYIALSPPVSA